MSEPRPRDDKGHFVPLACPRCGDGILQYDGGSLFLCNGLIDPGSTDKELEACPFWHWDGEAYDPHQADSF
jgi:hypothetical protein